MRSAGVEESGTLGGACGADGRPECPEVVPLGRSAETARAASDG